MTEPMLKIAVKKTPSCVSYILPPHELGLLKYIGIFLVAGAPSIAMAIIMDCRHLFPQEQGRLIYYLVGTVASIPLILFVWRVGFLIFAGHAEIVITRDKVSVIERLDFVRRTRSLPTKDFAKVEPFPPIIIQGIHISALKLCFDNTRRSLRVFAYPPNYMEFLAREITHVCGQFKSYGEFRSDESTAQANAVIQEKEPNSPPPPDSNITVEDDGQLLKINVPPQKSIFNTFLRFFLIVWFGMCFVSTTVIIVYQAWFFFLFITGFWVSGIVLNFLAQRLTRQQAILAVSKNVLIIVGFNIGGKIETDIPANKISDIVVGNSRITVNGRRLMELHIQPVSGKTIPLFTGRAIEELEWLASKLKHALKS